MDQRFLLPAVMLCVMISAMAPPSKENTQKMPEHASEKIKLPEPKYIGVISVEEALMKRRSVRAFKEGPVMLAELSQLMWAAQGMADQRGLRTAPSAGALYPLELYVVAGNVTGLPPGVYKYGRERHELLSLAKGDRRNDLCNAALGQSSIRRAALVLVLSGVYERTTAKYGERGIRYVHMEAGHAAQNVYLQTVSLGLGTVVIGAFQDEEVKRLLKMGDRESPLYIMPVGKR
jgi:SagB-type dehydrogenase family enzyme